MHRTPRYWQAIRALVLASSVCWLLGSCGSAAELQPLPTAGKILAFGDSLTYGVGAKASSSYPAQLQQLLGYPVIRSGVPGETTAEGRKRLPDVLRKTQPSLVLLWLGGNDFLQRRLVQQTQANLQAMIDLIKSHNIQVVLLAVPRFGITLQDADLYDALAERNAIPVIDELLGSVLVDRSLKSDSVHPNAAGYQQIANAVAEQLIQLGALPE